MLNIFLVAFSLAMDSFSVSIVLGERYKNKFKQGLFSSLIFGIFHFMVPIIGWLIGESFKLAISSVDHWIAFILLLFIGVKMVSDSIGKKKVKFLNEVIDFKSILLLAVATSIDALVIGMSIAFLGVPVLMTISVIGSVTFLLSLCGVHLSSSFEKVFRHKSELMGGVVLILIGLKVLIEHIVL